MSEEFKQDIHGWFGLSYCSYLVLPRSVLQSMPEEWQHKFVSLLEEIPKTVDFDKNPIDAVYNVRLRGEGGRYIEDYYKEYRRGGRVVPPPREDS